jgi:hypothetical protein
MTLRTAAVPALFGAMTIRSISLITRRAVVGFQWAVDDRAAFF